MKNEPLIKEDNILPFEPKVISGGKDGDPPWLSTLNPGTVFLTRPKGFDKAQCDEYHVIYQADQTTRLYNNLNNDFTVWVDTARFSRDNEWVETIHEEE